MATNLGNTTTSSYSQGFSTTVCWVLDAISIAGTLTSITIRNGASLGTVRPRVGVYKNTSTTSIDGATLVRDFGQMTGGTINTDQTLTAGDESLASGDVLWLVMKFSGTSAEITVANSAGVGEFNANGTGSLLLGVNHDPTIAFAGTASSFNAFDQGALTPRAHFTVEEASSTPTISSGMLLRGIG